MSMSERDDAVTELLKRARRRITDPDHWTQGSYAVDAQGNVALPKSPAAIRWCALGALEAEAAGRANHGRWGEARYAGAVRRLEALVVRDDGVTMGAIPDFNDERGHAAVLAMFDDAIRRK